MTTFHTLPPIYEKMLSSSSLLSNSSLHEDFHARNKSGRSLISKPQGQVGLFATSKYLFDVHASFHSPENMTIKYVDDATITRNNKSHYFEESKEYSNDSHSRSTRSLSTEASSVACFYIVRTNMRRKEQDDTPIELFPGAILGRTTVSRYSGRERRPRNSEDLRRVDIGIGYYKKNKRLRRNDDGISRNQVEIMDINDDEIFIKVGDNVKNPIVVWSGYHKQTHKAGQKVSLTDGDKIIFDAYMKEPRHIFEIVFSRNRNDMRDEFRKAYPV